MLTPRPHTYIRHLTTAIMAHGHTTVGIGDLQPGPSASDWESAIMEGTTGEAIMAEVMEAVTTEDTEEAITVAATPAEVMVVEVTVAVAPTDKDAPAATGGYGSAV
jgi:hypothetical protein